jgi:hypothetical protein
MPNPLPPNVLLKIASHIKKQKPGPWSLVQNDKSCDELDAFLFANKKPGIWAHVATHFGWSGVTNRTQFSLRCKTERLIRAYKEIPLLQMTAAQRASLPSSTPTNDWVFPGLVMYYKVESMQDYDAHHLYKFYTVTKVIAKNKAELRDENNATTQWFCSRESGVGGTRFFMRRGSRNSIKILYVALPQMIPASLKM